MYSHHHHHLHHPYLYELTSPLVGLPPGEAVASSLSLWPECLENRVALEPRCVSKGADWIRALEGGFLGRTVDAKVVVADYLDDFSTGQLHVGHPVVVGSHVGHLLKKR